MTTGIILLNFGEPSDATMESVVPFLERIFFTNASLESGASPDAVRARSHELAVQRAPGLIHEYEEIGGSPLNVQAQLQAEALAFELERRGHNVRTYVGMQFADPLIPEVVDRARADGVDRLIGLPVYPLCGPSTTVAALEQLAAAVAAVEWDVKVDEVSGWHRHPDYIALRGDAIRETARKAGVDLNAPRTKLVFSAHGTPMKYVHSGSRYVEYTEENCRQIADAAGVREYALGYQNHSNRPIEWTQPPIDDVIRTIDADVVVVDPVSFLHEQSETLAELDIELREVADERKLGYHRVPIPHDDPRVATVLADLVEWFMVPEPTGPAPRRCTCRATDRTCCLNGSVAR